MSTTSGHRSEASDRRHILFIESSVTGAGALAHSYARADGCFVTLVSRSPEQYSTDVVRDIDQIVTYDTRDESQVIRAAMAIDSKRPLDAVATTADLHVPSAALAAAALGLPGMTYDAATNARNKHRARLRLQEQYPDLNPEFCLVQSHSEAREAALEWGLPIVAKPLLANDGKGVKLIRTMEDLAAYMDARAAASVELLGEGVLLEQYVAGVEFSVETLQSGGGPLQLIGVTTKYLAGVDRGHFVEIGHSFPWLSGESAKLFDATGRAQRALGLDCGLAHTECRITASGSVKVIEVNPRLAGGMIGSHLVEIATGRNPAREVARIALGEDVRWTAPRSRGAALYGLCSPRRGTFAGLRNPQELLRRPGVVDVVVTVPPGQAVRPPESNVDVLVLVLASGDDEAAALGNASTAAELAELQIV